MMRTNSMKPVLLLVPLAMLLGIPAMQADASWFYDPATQARRNVGSAPSPTPQDLIVIRRGHDYPVRSRMFKEEGTVGLNIWLTENGAASDALVMQSSGYSRLDEAAIRYVKTNWHYKKARADWPMPKTVHAEVTFRLD